ncbi:ABC transporter permease [Oceanicella actignis]|uniref:ABC transporter permease n=1 Tax=Oceanicella actignis TaxID=1189325 RepID=UPI0011E8101E|nr:ABC transporter permease [Oceanicella actignis]TYO90103.1 lipoprotein-releasing system permease protein [Oceanicella actignis]
MSGRAPEGATRATAPFSAHEWLIAWRFLRARRAEGGVSAIVWYALAGIALAVGTLIVVMAVMVGFREEFTSRVLGAEGHVSVYPVTRWENGRAERALRDAGALAARIARIEGVTHVAPVVEAQLLASHGQRNAGVIARGMRLEDLRALPWIARPEAAAGALDDVTGKAVAIGEGVARELGVRVGDELALILPNGLATPFGLAPKQGIFRVAYIFRIGRADVDRTRLYMPLETAQDFFNRGDAADLIEAQVARPHELGSRKAPGALDAAIQAAVGAEGVVWTWKDANGAFLSALDMERATMFMILSMVVLIAALNIVSGLVMLVRNKRRDIGVLRTIGLSQGAVMRVFFLCGAGVGVAGTAIGVALGVLFVIYIDPIFDLVNGALGGGVWDPQVRVLSRFPAELRLWDVSRAAGLALTLSFLVTLGPARRAARLDPVEALRDE